MAPKGHRLELEQGSGLPDFVKKEYDEFLKCGILAHGFCGPNVSLIATKSLRPLAANAVGFAPVAEAEEWQKVLRT